MATKKKTKLTKALAKRGKASVPAENTYGDDAGAGFENATKDFYTIPFLAILQKGSPQVDEDDDRRIKGAKAGDIFNTVSSQIYNGKDGIRFIPVEPQHSFVEWVPREEGGGFVGIFTPDSREVAAAKEAAEEFGKYSIGDNDLVETFYMYGLLVKDGDVVEQCVLAFKSTQIKFFRNWMSIAANQTVGNVVPPLFAHIYRIKTFRDENKLGTFHSTRITLDADEAKDCRLLPTDDLYQKAKAYRSIVQSGGARADFESEQSDAPGDSKEF